jgi:phospholipase C
MSSTNYNWTPQHPRFVADLNSAGRADIVGIGSDCVWSALNNGALGFQQPQFGIVAFEANAGWRVGDHPRFVVDLDGDGRADILGFGDDGPWTAFGNGNGTFTDFRKAFEELGFNQGWTFEYPRFLADLSGNGTPDIIGFGRDGIWTALNGGNGTFGPPTLVAGDFSYNSGWRVEKHPRFVVDINGDGLADIVGFGDDGVWIALGDGKGSFQPAKFVVNDLGYNQGWRVETHARFVGDITGNGFPDVIGCGDAGVWVALNNGNGSFQPATYVLNAFGTNSGWTAAKHPRFVANLRDPGKADLIGFGDDGVWVSLSNGSGGFEPPQFVLQNLGFNQGWRVVDHPRMLADLDADGRPEIIGFGDDGVWVAQNVGGGGFSEAKFVLADFGRRSNRDTIVRNEIITDHRVKDRIKHVFVLMLENRSFDHMLGFAGLSGTDAATGQPTSVDGLDASVQPGQPDVSRFNTFEGQQFFPKRGAPDVGAAPGHDFGPVLEQLCGQYATYPSGEPYPDINNTGFVSSLDKEADFHGQGGRVMDCVDPCDLPILTQLASEFAVCDRWFCSMPGPTEPNRYFLSAANSGDNDESPDGDDLASGSLVPWDGEDLGETIFEVLDDADVDYKIYRGDHFPVVGEIKGVSNRFDTSEFDEDFVDDLNDDDFDASFIHIEPKYFDGTLDVIHHDFTTGNSQHPLGGVAEGERLIKKVYETIRNSRYWNSSMLIITYDEHGGFYDHVAPPPASPSGKTGKHHGFKFDQLGVRVPAVVVSPFIPKGLIEHRLLEHCSVIRTVCDLFNVRYPKDGRDIRKVCGVGHLAQLSKPRIDAPTTLNDVVVSTVAEAVPRTVVSLADAARSVGEVFFPGPEPRPLIDDPNRMVAKTLRAAAITDLRLHPERKAEILRRVRSIRTLQEAGTYIKEVEKEIDAARAKPA